MEFCSGGDLSQYIRQQRALPERITQHFLRQLGVALQFLFRRKIAHLDLKPHNLLLQPARDGTLTLKVADFGFAKKLYSGDVASSLRGSPLYMAPEMLKLRHYDARADLWSVGVIFFEALFGFAPFASGTYDELVAKILDDAPVVIPSVPALSPECIDLLKVRVIRIYAFCSESNRGCWYVIQICALGSTNSLSIPLWTSHTTRPNYVFQELRSC